MWMLLPALLLASMNIAGNNLALVPDMIILYGAPVFTTLVVAYLLISSMITALSAWMGMTAKEELFVIIKQLFAFAGKRWLALAMLAISLPASALTGCVFSGSIVYTVFGIPSEWAMLFSLLFFWLSSLSLHNWILAIAKYLTVCSIPLFFIVGMMQLSQTFWQQTLLWGPVNWTLVFAFVGYNTGGIRPALMVEASACLSKKGYQVIGAAVLSKLIEGCFTFLMALVVYSADIMGPNSLLGLAEKISGPLGRTIFAFFLYGLFLNTMAPAMKVNIKEVGTLLGISNGWSTLITLFGIYSISQCSIYTILQGMSVSGLLMIVLNIYTAYRLYFKMSRRN
ncbi:hypothetical protein Ga0466249_002007 [Sporomusaceae bacterium BoRhaA]|uniref:hypothetical protein n=1 Tax=Pelorhabdus rhamnosifermentans TaxID=2772457 RepID=UPI001C0634E3|nr:hypothetical protein [Pelorhabdus rhamnosifermentans]MBU2700896.1 hypothetical protein [Pelorhabdus rhamnosifermentans]